MSTLAYQLIGFYRDLKITATLPAEVQVLHPQDDSKVMEITGSFFTKYYNDNQPRTMILGINPGRHGAGITGINFTGPRQLTEYCNIPHPFGNGSELSAEFIYEMIKAYGGVEAFYSKYFISAVSPLGFIQQNKNLNYYDSKPLQEAITPFINECLDKQLSFAMERKRCFCIGEEKNFKFLSRLNEQRCLDGKIYFDEIIPLPHPRFIMQYRRKHIQSFIERYLEMLSK